MKKHLLAICAVIALNSRYVQTQDSQLTSQNSGDRSDFFDREWKSIFDKDDIKIKDELEKRVDDKWKVDFWNREPTNNNVISKRLGRLHHTQDDHDGDHDIGIGQFHGEFMKDFSKNFEAAFSGFGNGKSKNFGGYSDITHSDHSTTTADGYDERGNTENHFNYHGDEEYVDDHIHHQFDEGLDIVDGRDHSTDLKEEHHAEYPHTFFDEINKSSPKPSVVEYTTPNSFPSSNAFNSHGYPGQKSSKRPPIYSDDDDSSFHIEHSFGDSSYDPEVDHPRVVREQEKYSDEYSPNNYPNQNEASAYSNFGNNGYSYGHNDGQSYSSFSAKTPNTFQSKNKGSSGHNFNPPPPPSDDDDNYYRDDPSNFHGSDRDPGISDQSYNLKNQINNGNFNAQLNGKDKSPIPFNPYGSTDNYDNPSSSFGGSTESDFNKYQTPDSPPAYYRHKSSPPRPPPSYSPNPSPNSAPNHEYGKIYYSDSDIKDNYNYDNNNQEKSPFSENDGYNPNGNFAYGSQKYSIERVSESKASRYPKTERVSQRGINPSFSSQSSSSSRYGETEDQSGPLYNWPMLENQARKDKNIVPQKSFSSDFGSKIQSAQVALPRTRSNNSPSSVRKDWNSLGRVRKLN